LSSLESFRSRRSEATAIAGTDKHSLGYGISPYLSPCCQHRLLIAMLSGWFRVKAVRLWDLPQEPHQTDSPQESLVSFIRRSPLVGAGGLDLERLADPNRDPMA
jgi:hypothetical protein